MRIPPPPAEVPEEVPSSGALSHRPAPNLFQDKLSVWRQVNVVLSCIAGWNQLLDSWNEVLYLKWCFPMVFCFPGSFVSWLVFDYLFLLVAVGWDELGSVLL